MNRKTPLLKIIIAILTVVSLSACGEQAALIKVGPAGPNTGDLIDPLPEGLVPDKANSRHTANDLKPVIN